MGRCRGEGWVVRRTGRGIVDEIREKKKETSRGKYVRLITPKLHVV